MDRIGQDPLSVDGKHFVNGQLKEVEPDQDHDAIGSVESVPFNANETSSLSFELKPFEILHLTLNLPERLVEFSSSTSNSEKKSKVSEYADNDTRMVFGLGEDDMIIGGNGKDRLFGGAGDDQLFDGGGKNYLITNAKIDDQFFGGLGNDLIRAGRGNDILDGGGDADQLFGGSGRDTFIFSGGKDVILDFAPLVDEVVLSPEMQAKHDIFDSLDLPSIEVIGNRGVYRFSSEDQLIFDNFDSRFMNLYEFDLFWS